MTTLRSTRLEQERLLREEWVARMSQSGKDNLLPGFVQNQLSDWTVF